MGGKIQWDVLYYILVFYIFPKGPALWVEWRMIMAVIHDRKKIAEGVYLTKISDPKYKTNVVRVRFIVPIDPDKLGVNALLTSLLVTSNAKVPSRSELSKRFLGLYGTSVGAVWSNVTDYQTLGLTISAIMDRYTIGGEVISEEAVQMLLDCIFDPDLKDGKFNEKYFKLRKQELLDAITEVSSASISVIRWKWLSSLHLRLRMMNWRS